MKKYLIFIGFTTLCSPSVHCQVAHERAKTISKFATFIGGVETFYRYLGDNIQYSADAKRDSIVGDVFIEFKIDTLGAVDKGSVKVVKGLCPTCDKEAERLIKSSPKWIPGEADGKKIEQVITFPVSFRLDN